MKRIFSSDSAILPDKPNGPNYTTNNMFSDAHISRGSLVIVNELLRGEEQSIFRWQNGHFEMIGFSSTSIGAGSGTIYEVDYNLSTSLYLSREYSVEAEKTPAWKRATRVTHPKPALEKFSAYNFAF
jgi:hypothetical protein